MRTKPTSQPHSLVCGHTLEDLLCNVEGGNLEQNCAKATKRICELERFFVDELPVIIVVLKRMKIALMIVYQTFENRRIFVHRKIADFDGEQGWMDSGNVLAATPKIFTQLLTSLNPPSAA